MPFALRITSLTFSGADDPVEAADSDLVILIGPNNVGKSQALREIEVLAKSGQAGMVVTAQTLRRDGSGDELLSWFTAATSAYPVPAGTEEHRTLPSGNAFPLSAARQIWENVQHLSSLSEALIFRADAEQRLQLASSVASVDILDGQAVQPLQRLMLDHDAEERLSRAVTRAFGLPVHVNRAGGAQLHLHLGSTESEPRLDSADYREELLTLPRVPAQGDGMRSFIGLLLALSATPYPVVLIDEPEAFLHPPQARELGRQLASADSGQRVVATHSADVLLGILDAEASTTIVRLRREGDRNVPSVLSRGEIQKVWRDPSLRYSNLLDGLFHTGVVITEGDGDARLYNAALDVALSARGDPSTDLLFTHCGGKHDLPKAIGALRPLGVPVVAVADVDILRSEELLSQTVSALGGAWEPLRQDWSVLSNAVGQHPVESALVGDVRRQIDSALGADDTARLTENQSRRIREVTKTANGWKAIRGGGGQAAFPRGQAAEAGARLLAGLRAVGLFVVPVGELEGWAPTLGGHGRRFVQQALSDDVHRSNEALQLFTDEIAAFLHDEGTD